MPRGRGYGKVKPPKLPRADAEGKIDGYPAVGLNYFLHHSLSFQSRLPIILTKFGVPVAFVESYAVKSTKTDDTEAVYREIIKYGIDYYRQHPDKISPSILLKAIEALDRMDKATDLSEAVALGMGEAFEEDKKGEIAGGEGNAEQSSSQES